jgi:hypothetical protein
MLMADRASDITSLVNTKEILVAATGTAEDCRPHRVTSKTTQDEKKPAMKNMAKSKAAPENDAMVNATE